MVNDDVYDQPNEDLYYWLKAVEGGWQIIDMKNSERFKTVYVDKDEATDLCKTLNDGQSARDVLDFYNGEARWSSD